MKRDDIEIFQIENLFLRSRYILKGFFSGLHKVPYKGFSAEFSEYREYIQGDDFKRIDWKIFLRSEKLFIRENEGESDANVYVFLDSSRSMSFMNKFEYGKTLLFLFAMISKKQNDSFGYCLYNDKKIIFKKPSKKRNLLYQINKDLLNIKPEGMTNGGSVLKDILPDVKRSSFVIFITDFCEDLDSLIKTISYFSVFKNDSIIFHIQSKREYDRDNFNGNYLKDMESEKIFFPDSVEKNIKILKDRTDRIKNISYENGIDYNHIFLEDSFSKPLSLFFLRRKNVFL